MSPVSTQYASAFSGLDVLVKGNPNLVKIFSMDTLEIAAGLAAGTFGGPIAGIAIVAGLRAAIKATAKE